MAVLDLIPHGVSSVYVLYCHIPLSRFLTASWSTDLFSYDPDFEAWEFGKLSALREIALTIEGGYQYYYMGRPFYSSTLKDKLSSDNIKDTTSTTTKKCGTRGPSDLNMFWVSFIIITTQLAIVITDNKDPESHTWNPLDGELAQKLDHRLYVSLSRDHQTTPAPEADPNINDEDETLSLFDLHMPGILTAAQVQTHLDLDHWLLRIHGIFVYMNDLVGWEGMDMVRDPVKRIIAELAAALGPGVVRGSAVVLFE